MASERAACLFGTETELGVFAESSGRMRPAPTELAAALVEEVGSRCPHVPSPDPLPRRRLYLGNGACVYADVGGHPEIASAECSSPVELCAQTLALRRMLAESAEAVGSLYETPVRLVANNVDYALRGPRSYGHHVNVLLTRISLEQAVRQLAPLLAALPVLSGTGKVSFAKGAAGFELSQRAGHMCSVLSGRTTSSRAMVTAKDEPLSKNGARLHVISIDTAMSPWQLLLIPGVLVLSAKAVEAGHDIAGRLALADPVQALQRVSCDPSLRAELPLAAGGFTTVLDILEAYRAMVEGVVETDELPDWAESILAVWGEVLGNLRSDPFLEYGRLDWVTKLTLFTQMLEDERMGWREFARWTYVLASVRRLKASHPELDPREMGSATEARTLLGRAALGVLDRYLATNALSWKDLPDVWRAATRLCHLCVSYHMFNQEPREPGSADRLCPLISEEMIQLARTTPPGGTRAAVRGEAIRKAPPGAEAGWTFVRENGRRLVMEDAFGRGTSWVEEQCSASRETG